MCVFLLFPPLIYHLLGQKIVNTIDLEAATRKTNLLINLHKFKQVNPRSNSTGSNSILQQKLQNDSLNNNNNNNSSNNSKNNNNNNNNTSNSNCNSEQGTIATIDLNAISSSTSSSVATVLSSLSQTTSTPVIGVNNNIPQHFLLKPNMATLTASNHNSNNSAAATAKQVTIPPISSKSSSPSVLISSISLSGSSTIATIVTGSRGKSTDLSHTNSHRNINNNNVSSDGSNENHVGNSNSTSKFKNIKHSRNKELIESTSTGIIDITDDSPPAIAGNNYDKEIHEEQRSVIKESLEISSNNANITGNSMDILSSAVMNAGGNNLKMPQRRRVRRKATSTLDDQAEHLTEMSVRGLDLFRYASISEGVYQCTECAKENVQKTFKNKYSFQRHAFLYHEGKHRKVFPCPVCGKEFSRPDKMKNHMKTTHECFIPKEVNYHPLNYLITAAAAEQFFPQAQQQHQNSSTNDQQQQQQQQLRANSPTGKGINTSKKSTTGSSGSNNACLNNSNEINLTTDNGNSSRIPSLTLNTTTSSSSSSSGIVITAAASTTTNIGIDEILIKSPPISSSSEPFSIGGTGTTATSIVAKTEEVL